MLLIGAILLAVFVLPDPWGLPVIVVGAVVEVAETLFWMRVSQRGRVKVGPETLIGASAEVVEACRPIGRVRVRSELWRARCEEGADVGERVRVHAREGLTLLVERLA